MSGHAVIAALGATVIATVDALLVARVLRAWRKTRKRPHLVIAAGVVASYLAVVGACLVLAAEGTPSIRTTMAWPIARTLSFVGAGLAYGLVGLFSAAAFGRGAAALPLGLMLAVGLAAMGVGGALVFDGSIATPATTPWAFRLPFVALALAGSLGGGVRALSLSAAYGRAARAGRSVDPVALGRMRTMALGFFAMAAGELPLLGFAPHGRFDGALGLACVAAIMLGALGFVLSCVATWATPAWLRARWARGAP